MATLHAQSKNNYRYAKIVTNPKQEYTRLKGVDLESEFLKIKHKTSTLSATDRALVIARVQYLEAVKKEKANDSD